MGGELSEEIDTAFDAEKSGDYRSSRIGASIVGNPCTAYLAFAIRGFPEVKTSPRLKRIFRDGHRIEAAVIADIKKAGYTVYEKDPMTGKQYMWDRYNGHLVFYADGIIEEKATGEGLLLEVKSMNDAYFNKFKDRGVKVSHRKYFDQLQMGMGLSGYKRAIIIAYNKDTSEYWDQVVYFDDLAFHALLSHVENVLTGKAQKVATDKSDWRCKDCPRRLVCWEDAPVIQDMRTCKNSYPAHGGWQCTKGCVGQCGSWERYEPEERAVKNV